MQKEFTKTLAQFMDKMEDERDAVNRVKDQIMKENIQKKMFDLMQTNKL